MEKFTVAIIAGGKSSRMGTNKSFVTLGGKPIIEHVIERVSNLGQAETLLITNRPDEYAYLNLPMHGDVLPEKGSLGGIYTAIHHSQHPHTLVVACDMPFINAELLQYMLTLRENVDVVVPRVENYPEGMHAIYSKACLQPIRQRLEQDNLKIIGFYETVQVRSLDEPEYERFDSKGLSFFNVNTPEELEKARQLVGYEYSGFSSSSL